MGSSVQTSLDTPSEVDHIGQFLKISEELHLFFLSFCNYFNGRSFAAGTSIAVNSLFIIGFLKVRTG